MKPRVLVLLTGGTIGMAASADGYRPMTGFAQLLEQEFTRRDTSSLLDFDVVELGELIDSANLVPAHWREIAGELIARWDDYAGFVVLHGTDTMADSASALSFMLRGMDKPVIFTGSQIPLVEPRSDARENLQTALMLAAGPNSPLREVCLYFNRRLLRGNRSRKMKSSSFDAFDSPNFPHLAAVGIDIAFHHERLLPQTTRDFSQPLFDPEAVAVLSIYPGMTGRIVEVVSDHPTLRGLVLHTYGVGNAPDANLGLMKALARAVENGVVILNVTQCPTGCVSQGDYATGDALRRIGVVGGGDMTPEAAFAKLHYLLARERDHAIVRQQLAQSLCGELTVSTIG